MKKLPLREIINHNNKIIHVTYEDKYKKILKLELNIDKFNLTNLKKRLKFMGAKLIHRENIMKK